MSVVRRASAQQRVSTVREVLVLDGLTTVEALEEEMDEYASIILGRRVPPVDNGILTLQECADAYHARAREIEALIYRGERKGRIPKNSPLMKFRTGELQSYISMFRNSADLGSRRLSNARYEAGMM